MAKKIYVKFPEFNITVTATLQEEAEPELCQLLWDKLPLRSACCNTLSTGDLFISRCRPPRKAIVPGTQDNPIGRNSIMYCDREPGDIGFTGVDFVVNYGPDVTEPLAGHGAIVAKVDPEYIDDFYKAGKSVWHNHVSTHTLVTMVIEKKED